MGIDRCLREVRSERTSGLCLGRRLALALIPAYYWLFALRGPFRWFDRLHSVEDGRIAIVTSDRSNVLCGMTSLGKVFHPEIFLKNEMELSECEIQSQVRILSWVLRTSGTTLNNFHLYISSLIWMLNTRICLLMNIMESYHKIRRGAIDGFYMII